MGVKDCVRNIMHGIYNTIPHILQKNVKHNFIESISIKTFNSISLPIYSPPASKEAAQPK